MINFDNKPSPTPILSQNQELKRIDNETILNDAFHKPEPGAVYLVRTGTGCLRNKINDSYHFHQYTMCATHLKKPANLNLT